MVMRYALKCENCAARIILRIRVGFGSEESFAFDCCRCAQPISGVMQLDQKAVKVLGLARLSGVVQTHDDLDVPTADCEHRQDNWFLVDSDKAGNPHAFSSFLDATQRHGPDLFTYLRNQAALQQIIELSPTITRTLHNCQRRQWDYFATGAEEILGEGPEDGPLGRLDAILMLLQVVHHPLIDRASQRRLMFSYRQFVDGLEGSLTTAFWNFLGKLRDQGYLVRSHLDGIELAIRWLQVCSDFQPIIAERDPTQPGCVIHTSLRCGSPNQLHAIKSLYVDAYEAVCRGLTIVMGMVNVAERHDCDLFSSHPDVSLKTYRPTNLEHFHRMNNAPKLRLANAHPLFRRWLGDALDSSLRNAIGHNAFDAEANQQIITYRGRNGIAATLTYSSFLMRILDALVCAHQLNWFCGFLIMRLEGFPTLS